MYSFSSDNSNYYEAESRVALVEKYARQPYVRVPRLKKHQDQEATEEEVSMDVNSSSK